MIEGDPQDKPSPPNTEASSSPTPVSPPVEDKLEAVIRDLPEPKQEQLRTTLRETFMAFVERSAGPRIDAETARILASSADKDNENRFKYLSQKQKDAADASLREHELEKIKHQDRVKIFWPILITVLVATVGCLAVGIYLAATGREMLGTGLITGTAFAVAGYLAGVGTSDFFKEN
ncbi:MAG TPA: hypothetical protein VF717_05985 [Pyrinomonadaceae bacterium]|jgi:hypothetical protein